MFQATRKLFTQPWPNVFFRLRRISPITGRPELGSTAVVQEPGGAQIEPGGAQNQDPAELKQTPAELRPYAEYTPAIRINLM